MKKMIAILLALIMMFCLTACGGKFEENAAPAASETVPQSEPTERPQNEKQLQTNGTEVSLEALMKASATSGDLFIFAGRGGAELWVDAYEGTDNMVVIPAKYESTPITSVTSYTFGVDSIVEAIRFNDTTTEIVEFVCATNEVLRIVVLGTGTQKIGASAFQKCSALETLILNDGLQEIGQMAFMNCRSLKEVTIPSTVTSIDPMAFLGCHEEFTIYGEAGSYAETFASENGIPFVAK